VNNIPDDPSKHPAFYKVTRYLWEYTIPRIHYYSREELARKGFAGSYNRDSLAKLMKERMIVSGTLIEIARHHYEDHDPQLVNPMDSVPIYLAICEHLEEATRIIARNSNLGDVPVDDLRALADLARDIHPVASNLSPTIKEDKKISRFKRLAGNGLRPGIRTGKRDRVEEEKRVVAPHDPIFGSIERYLELNERDRRATEGNDDA